MPVFNPSPRFGRPAVKLPELTPEERRASFARMAAAEIARLDAQYRALVRLLRALASRYPLVDVAGHEHVAPGRKADPGARFEWPRLTRALGRRVAVATVPGTD